MKKVPVPPDHPTWCKVNHDKISPTFHALCTGEVRRQHSSVVLIVTREDEGDGVELAYHMDGKPPSIALLSGTEVRDLRDYLDLALEAVPAT